MYKVEVKENAKYKYQTHYAEGYNYKFRTTEKLIFERYNASDLKFLKDDVNVYFEENNEWYLIDHTLWLSDKYNKMLIEAQKRGFKNVYEAFDKDYSFKVKYTKKATN